MFFCGQLIILPGYLTTSQCIDGLDIIPTIQLVSQHLSYLLLLTFVDFYYDCHCNMECRCTCNLYARYSAFWQLVPFSLDNPASLCNIPHTLLIKESQNIISIYQRLVKN